MGSKNPEWKDPLWAASAVGYEFRPNDERQAISYLTIRYRHRWLVSLKGFAARYDWSRKKARRFLRDAGVKLVYPEGEEKGRSAHGYLVLLPEAERNPKTEHLRIITHGVHYF